MYVHSALTSTLYGTSRPGHFTSGKERTVPTFIGSWVDPKAGLDALEKGYVFVRAGIRTMILRVSEL